jgi:hypothetical protein
VSRAEVRRDGLAGVRPGRESRTWSWNGHGGTGKRRAPHDHPGDSYYGAPIINPPVWEERNIAGYLFAGGLAGASSILAAGADLSGRRGLARGARVTASGATGLSLVALVHDLGRPRRFLNMLRVIKPTSPMSIGSWLLAGYAPLCAAAAASDLLARAPKAGRAAGIGAGVLGAAVSTYTAALIADTAVPVWHDARRELPFVFAGSAAAAAAGAALISAPHTENAPARRMAVLGALGELAASQLMEHRLGLAGEALHAPPAHNRLRAAKMLNAAGALGAATIARRDRGGAATTGAALLAGSALTRFGLFAAGMASARDPRHTIEPQRQRVEARQAATDGASAPAPAPPRESTT